MDFFKEMPQIFIKVGYILNTLYGSDCEKRLQVNHLHHLIFKFLFTPILESALLTQANQLPDCLAKVSTAGMEVLLVLDY